MTPPPFYNNLPLTLDTIAALWMQGAQNRRSPLHTPVVASIAEGRPSQRVMVLREVDWSARTMRFHTDARSSKIDQMQDGAPVSVLGYHPDEKAQMRMEGRAHILTQGPVFDAAWQSSTLYARRCYMALEASGAPSAAPTSGLSPDIEGIMPTAAQIGPAKANFAVVLIEFDEIDWLYLANAGHRRAQFRHCDAAGWQGHWCVP